MRLHLDGYLITNISNTFVNLYDRGSALEVLIHGLIADHSETKFEITDINEGILGNKKFRLKFSCQYNGAVTVYKAPQVKTFNQGTSCLCSEYSTLHALEVRYLQREGKSLFLSRSAAQWNQLYDRFEEQIRGYRTNALIPNNECFSEASFPHNVIRTLLQYGNHPDTSSQTTVSINLTSGAKLKEAAQTGNSYEEKTSHLTKAINSSFGEHQMDVNFAKQVIKDDQWVGYVPSATSIDGWTLFEPPSFLADQLPIPEKMPLIRKETRTSIFQRIINSLKRGVPVVYCASSHCQSIDGVKVKEDGTIQDFYYAGSYGENDFIWGDKYGPQYGAPNGFLYLILEKVIE